MYTNLCKDSKKIRFIFYQSRFFCKKPLKTISNHYLHNLIPTAEQIYHEELFPSPDNGGKGEMQ